jgi:hypothetical protein
VARWKKRLAEIVTDRRPVSYTYDELAGLLVNHLGFELAKAQGSHRKFRRDVPDSSDPTRPEKTKGVIIGLLDYGSGPVPPEYVKQMVQTLQANDLIPDGVL